jgi:hypothetical protein
MVTRGPPYLLIKEVSALSHEELRLIMMKPWEHVNLRSGELLIPSSRSSYAKNTAEKLDEYHP